MADLFPFILSVVTLVILISMYVVQFNHLLCIVKLFWAGWDWTWLAGTHLRRDLRLR